MRGWRSTVEALLGAFWYLTVGVLLPLAVLVALGVIHLWQAGWLLPVLGAWLVIAMLAYAVYHGAPRLLARRRSPAAASVERAGAPPPGELPDRLAERPDWSRRDRAVWDECCAAIDQALAEGLAWEGLQTYAVQLLGRISARYHPAARDATWRFTLPEALLIAEEASRRYRAVVMEHVPYADRVPIASVLTIYRRRDQIRTGFTWLNRTRRLARLANPMAALLGELRDRVTDRVLERVSRAMQTSLKRLLLQEIAQAGIDLYSGRLKVSDRELARDRSEAARAAPGRPEPAEPLGVVLLGPTGAGKTSLVHALTAAMHAQHGLLPRTERAAVHRLVLEEGPEVRLTDTPGLDAADAGGDGLADLALQADLLIWVARAGAPACPGGRRLMERIRARYESDPQRRPPPSLLVLTHVDALAPEDEWAPPYDLEAGSGKARTIRAALEGARGQIGLDAGAPAVPVCLSPARGVYNVDAVGVQIRALGEAAMQAQLNRRRLEHIRRSVRWSERWRQVRNLGVALGRAVTRE